MKNNWINLFLLHLTPFASLHSYGLEVGEKASERLDIQHLILKADSENHLLEAGIKEGMVVLDLGCGNGIMTLWIASLVGKKGRVIAVDSSPEQLKIAKERALAEGISNIEFICSDAESLTLPQSSLDLIYSRFLLMHLHSPLTVIQKAFSFLKDDGVFVSEEPINSSIYLYPENRALIEDLKTYFQSLSRAYQVDYDLGARLYTLFHFAGYPDVQLHFSQRALSIPQMKDVVFRILGDTETKALKAGVISEKRLEALRHSIQSASEERGSYFIMPQLAHIRAYKT